MIHFFAAFSNAFEGLFETWAPEVRAEFNFIRYRQIPFLGKLAPGVCIFSDLEYLPRPGLRFAAGFCRRLQAQPERFTVLNDPALYLGRFGLLRELHARGGNEFRAFRVDAVPPDARYPVFIRHDGDHRGSLTALLRDPQELQQALRALSPRDRWLRRRRLMVVEYADCVVADGIIRKYSVMKVGGRLVPRHILFSRRWVVKKPDLVDAETVRQETAFIEACPHLAEVDAVFKLARLDYGRIDYGFRDGRMQVWEINTNPTVIVRRENINPLRLPSQGRTVELSVQAFLALSRQHAATDRALAGRGSPDI